MFFCILADGGSEGLNLSLFTAIFLQCNNMVNINSLYGFPGYLETSLVSFSNQAVLVSFYLEKKILLERKILLQREADFERCFGKTGPSLYQNCNFYFGCVCVSSCTKRKGSTDARCHLYKPN